MFYRLCLHPAFVLLLSSTIVITFFMVGALSFGNALLFDRMYFVVLVIVILTCHRNVNILGVVLLSMVLRLFEESAFILLVDLTFPLKICLYSFIGYFFWRWRYDSLSPLLFGILSITIAAEIYWQYSAYPAPGINWEMLLIFLAVFARHCLFRRIWWTERFFPQQGYFLRLDWQLQQLCTLQILIISAVSFEYILRHLGITDSTFIYQKSTSAHHTVNLLQLFSLFWQNYQLRLSKIFDS